jgi:hypothetical protein
MHLIIAGMQVGVVAGTLALARMTRPDRNYHPLLVVIWTATAAIYGGSFVANLTGEGGRPSTVTRVVFSAVMLAAVLFALWFVRKRNTTPRFLGLSINGDIIVTPVEDLRQMATMVESWAAHGAMPAEVVERQRAALAEWEAKRAWARGLAAGARARRLARERDAERGGIPDD